jgi:muramoyltetrapeptide carboxypeptidase
VSALLKPPRLRSGDRIAIVSPASPFQRDEFDKGVAELRRLGFEPVFDDRVFARHGGYLSGAGAVRARAFLDAWRDPLVRALIAVRGGYGSVHLLPFLDDEDLRKTPKPFIGYSDLTTVLTYLTLQCGIVSFHGPMLDRRLGNGIDAYDRGSFINALSSPVALGELPAPDLQVLRQGEATGPLVGGTLAQLVASLGTPYAFKPSQGHVLFLEDVGERPYRLDRMLTQLRLAGVIETASALVFGEFRDCDEPRGEPSARGTLADLVKDFKGPVVFGFPSGHTRGPLVTLPFGIRTRVVADGTPRVIVEESAVE